MEIFNTRNNTAADGSGFAMLYAVIVVAVISSLGAVLSSLIVREADLSATARQSSRAYYSADAGIECAQFWDLQKDHFPRGSASDKGDIECAGNPGVDVTAKKSGSDQIYTFTINNEQICSKVEIVKTTVGVREVTRIESVGSDVCGDTRVQRAFRTTY